MWFALEKVNLGVVAKNPPVYWCVFMEETQSAQSTHRATNQELRSYGNLRLAIRNSEEPNELIL